MATAGKDAVLKVAYADAGSVTDITAKLTSVSGPSIDFQVAEVSVLGDVFKAYIKTQTDPGVLEVEGVYDHAIGSALYSMGTAGTAQAFEFYPMGTAAGATKFSGSAIVTTTQPSSDRDDAVLFTASLQLTGTPTMGTA